MAEGKAEASRCVKVAAMSDAIPFEQTYRTLPERFYSEESPRAASQPKFIAYNEPLASSLGLPPSWDTTAEGLALLSGRAVLQAPSPLSMFYAGHQFGQFNPALGDGRAILIGELVDGEGARFDIQLKGSGPTQHSRGGDGLSPLGPVIREYLMSEFMFYAGVPTSRSLAAISTGDPVYRERSEPGGVLTRVTSSHIRFGTFQYFAARGDDEALQHLTDYVIARHYPDCQDTERPALALLEQVMQRTAALIAAWQGLGFIHGVMNTDNMLICGETIDYGPCAMMDGFRINQVFSSIDHAGRYAYHQQPAIGQWNLMALADALLPIIDPDREEAIRLAKGVLEGYGPAFKRVYAERCAAKLGLEASDESDTLFQSLLEVMQKHQLDFTDTFIELESIRFNGLKAPESLSAWLPSWFEALDGKNDTDALATMRKANPALIARNHQIEFAIQEACVNEDFTRFDQLRAAVTDPFNRAHTGTPLSEAPKPEETVLRTFCGT